MEIQFDEAKHEYSVNGKRIPGVTEILSPITADGYSKINPAVLEHAAMKGTLVHDWCEMFDLGCADEFMPSEIVPYCQAYADFIRDYRPEWEKIEEIVGYKSEPDDWWYAGRLDRCGYINGKRLIVDIKTIASPSTKTHISVCCQTAAYAYAVDNIASWDRYALYLKPDGTYRLFNCAEYEEKNNFNGEDLFIELLMLYKKINNIGRKKK